jgi:type II restriction enzyme
MQFQHPGSGTDSNFQLYPFRLIFKLLLDERLGGRLYNNEVEYLIVFQDRMNATLYEKLVKEILKLRSATTEEMAFLFRADEHTYVNAVHEWEYFTQSLFEQIGIINRVSGEEICRLYHPSKTNTKSNPTHRKATAGYIELKPQHKEFINKMLEKYPYDAKPVMLSDPERLKADVIKEIYSFYPKLLLNEIGETDNLSNLLKLPKMIEEYSQNPENETACLFEDVLENGFNMFYNVEAKGIGGSGHTDMECLYLTKKKKFAVEAKSTANKLSGINAGRLKKHRDEISGEYTIVVTSRYVPSVKYDIAGTPIVIVLANTFAEYLYNHIFHEVKQIDYADFDNIIVNNLGCDISKLISDITLDKFAAVG